jgi:cytochrome P450
MPIQPEVSMTDLTKVNFSTDTTIIDDPHPYFDWLRKQGPIHRIQSQNIIAITGHKEAVLVSRDTEHFSAANAVIGSNFELPFEVKGDDIAAAVAAHRSAIPFSDQIASLDGDEHLRLRSLLTPLFTPTKLKSIEPRLREISDQIIDEFIQRGEVELVSEYGSAFATLVIAELLGIPEEDRIFMREQRGNSLVGGVAQSKEENAFNPLVRIAGRVGELLADRRESPRDDVLGALASSRFPDGTLPSLEEITGLGAFLFGAGRDTTARLLGNLFRVLGENLEMQEKLRASPAQIPPFVEEALRFDGSVKSSGRLCIRTTNVAGVDIKAGDKIVLMLLGANHDPRRFPEPRSFDSGRLKNAEHIGFGRGPHTCIGAPLARLETKISIERLLNRLGPISISDQHHGPQDRRTFHYDPSYVLRAISELHLSFQPF